MRLRLSAAALVSSLALLAPSAAQALSGFTTGFNADPVFLTGSPAHRALWIDRAVGDGAGMVRLNVNWNQVAPPSRAPDFIASNPASRGYNWSATDRAVRELTSQGLQVLITVIRAPSWAEGPNRPAVAAGSWRPDPVKFGDFATAITTRYSGHFPDPKEAGAFLPQVRYWQAWNEPNIGSFLNPQWTRSGGRLRPESPILYRELLNAFYTAAKRVSPSNFVVAAGTAPYGNRPGGYRIPPVQFDRGLFCLRDDAGLTPMSCPVLPYLDAVDDHPYGIFRPTWHALNPDDTATPDVYRIARVLRAAERSHHVLPAGKKAIWATENSWDSNPPDPHGIPVDQQARFVEQTLYVLWSQGVDTMLWLQIADSPPVPSYSTTYQGGMYYLGGHPKPAVRALRFPLVARRVSSRLISVWGRAPQQGSLLIEAWRGGRWKPLRRLQLSYHAVFLTTVALGGRAALRAQTGRRTSLVWTVPR